MTSLLTTILDNVGPIAITPGAAVVLILVVWILSMRRNP